MAVHLRNVNQAKDKSNVDKKSVKGKLNQSEFMRMFE